MSRTILGLMLATGLAACGSDPAQRYAVDQPVISDRIPVAFRTIEVREVSLPTYASSDEIHLRDATGVLRSSPDVLWADAPERAVALELSRNLAKLTNARIASAPWPFEAFPDARLEVRFEELLANDAGTFQARGQYFVGTEDTRRERSGLFDLSVPYASDGGPNAIAAARGQLMADLTQFIARNGLR